jgi:hypothetical protein
MNILKFTIAILFFLCILELSNTKQPIKNIKNDKKKFGEKCKRRIFGSECGNGLECSKKQGICLKRKNQLCSLNTECNTNKCVNGKCR